MEELMIRVSRLERELVLWRLALAALVLILGGFALVGCFDRRLEAAESGAKTLRVEKLELVEGDRVLADLSVENGGPQLRLLDSNGGVRARLWHDDEATALYLNDGAGHTRVGVAQFAHGGGGFALHGEESKGAAVLYLKDAQGSLTFIDREGKVLSRVAPEVPSP